MKLKRFKLKQVLIGLGGVLLTLPFIAAFEAHVINVTAEIENGVLVVPQELEFGTTFPQEALDKNVTIQLSDSFLGQCTPGSDLITNGGFETPVVVNGAQWDIFPSGTAGLGWTVGWEPGQPTTFGPGPTPQPAVANLELHRGVAGWLPHSGQQHSELDSDWDGPSGPLTGEPALVNIYQDIPTVIGQTYRLSYAYSPRPGLGLDENELLVRINGSQIDSHNAVGGGNTSWTVFTNDVVATSTTTRVEFAASGTPDSLGVFLDDVSFMSLGRVCNVDYVLRQKPKCADNNNPAIHPQVTEDGNTFVCPEGSHEMPLLCPYLSKHETTSDGNGPENDSPGINSFHGLPGPWTLATTIATQQTGVLSNSVLDLADTWNIDLHVPCFTEQCAQDWARYVHAQNPEANPADYQLNPELEHSVFGCDLWFEVTNID